MPGRRQHGEGSLYQRSSDGRWIATVDVGWNGPRRVRRVFTAKTYQEAIAKRAAFLEARKDGFTIPKGRPPYVGEWMTHWLHNVARAKVQPSTWHSSYRHVVEDLIVPYFERVPLPELDEEQIEAWHRQLERRPRRGGGTLSATTIGQAHQILSMGLKVAVVRGRLPRNPCSNVSPPRRNPPEPQPASADEVRLIVARCRTWPNGARWILAIATGLRQGEALALEWRDVRLADPASVTVRASAAQVNGERIVKAPKSKSSRRTVPLARVAVESLRAHRKTQVANIANGLVFTDRKGQPVEPTADGRDWRALLADLGLRHYRVHDLRHGFATILLEGGADPRLVQELMGHSSTALLQVYQHVRPVLHERALGILDQALGDV